MELGRSLVYKHKEPLDFAEKQLSIFWLPDEPKVENDVQDILVNFSESEKHGVLTTLKLFSLYEDVAGNEYWGSRFKKIFKDDASFYRMATAFSFFEINVHLPFYKKINELLGLDTDEFYTSYVDDPVLKDRMNFVGSVVDSKNDLFSLAAFTFVEGAVLYTSFAYLKHFQQNGKNKLMNIVRGINSSLKDENVHALAGAWSFKFKKHQSKLSKTEESELKDIILQAAQNVYEHEEKIVEKIFEKGEISNISAKDLKEFAKSRVNECLENLGYKKLYTVKNNPIGEWFYLAINSYSFTDNFTGLNNQYHRNWDEKAFTW